MSENVSLSTAFCFMSCASSCFELRPSRSPSFLCFVGFISFRFFFLTVFFVRWHPSLVVALVGSPLVDAYNDCSWHFLSLHPSHPGEFLPPRRSLSRHRAMLSTHTGAATIRPLQPAYSPAPFHSPLLVTSLAPVTPM
jgi:hypothetical protein